MSKSIEQVAEMIGVDVDTCRRVVEQLTNAPLLSATKAKLFMGMRQYKEYADKIIRGNWKQRAKHLGV